MIQYLIEIKISAGSPVLVNLYITLVNNVHISSSFSAVRYSEVQVNGFVESSFQSNKIQSPRIRTI